MIIPEDNKASRQQAGTSYGAAGEDGQTPSGSRSQQPLFRNEDIIEGQYDPPPLYSESTPLRGGEKGRRRSWRMLVAGSAVLLALIVILSLRHGRSPYGHGPGSDDSKHGGALPGKDWPGPDSPPRNPGQQEPSDPPAQGDGVPSHCADYQRAEWHELPGLSRGRTTAYGANVTWTVDTEDLFTHIFNIPGDIVINAYSSIEREITESIINIQALIRTKDRAFQRSQAWDWLMMTDVCQGDRQGNQHGKGVVVNSRRKGPASTDNDSLEFRVTVSLPVNVQQTAEFPFISSLDLRTPVGDIIFTDITAVNLYKAYAATKTGDIVLHNVRARDLEVKSSAGDLRGRAAASSRLIAQTDVGNIDFYIQVPKMRFDPNDMMSTWGVTTSCDRQLRPIEITTTTHSGDVTLRYDDWEDPCRRISHEGSTETGDVNVIMNPFFEGPFELSTLVGDVRYKDDGGIDDPLGMGRRRHTKFDRVPHGGVLRKLFRGVVWWDGGYQDHPELPPWQGNRSLPGARLSTTTGDIKFLL